MANVSKLNLLGNVYNITDRDAQNKIAELTEKVNSTPTFWVGTLAEYNALTTKDNKTFYYITEK